MFVACSSNTDGICRIAQLLLCASPTRFRPQRQRTHTRRCTAQPRSPLRLPVHARTWAPPQAHPGRRSFRRLFFVGRCFMIARRRRRRGFRDVVPRGGCQLLQERFGLRREAIMHKVKAWPRPAQQNPVFARARAQCRWARIQIKLPVQSDALVALQHVANMQACVTRAHLRCIASPSWCPSHLRAV